MTEQRYLLAVAHQPGPDPRIAKGMDGRRDYFTEAELEKAAFSFLADGGRQIGLYHMDGTAGVADVVESYVYRGPDWTLCAVDGSEQVIKSGTWLIGMICDPVAWDLYKTGRVTGVSIQGAAKRREVAKGGVIPPERRGWFLIGEQGPETVRRRPDGRVEYLREDGRWEHYE